MIKAYQELPSACAMFIPTPPLFLYPQRINHVIHTLLYISLVKQPHDSFKNYHLKKLGTIASATSAAPSRTAMF